MIVVQQHAVAEGEAAEGCWRVYTAAFEELRTRAVQRHVMTREEFDGVLADKRVIKYVTLDPARRGRMCAVAGVTNELEAMPLISPEYFARRWPEHYAAGRIWYVGFVAVDPDYHGTGVFVRLVEEMYERVAATGGVAALDICRHNDEVYRLPSAVARLTHSLDPGVECHRLDEQTYWAYEFPTGR